MRRAQCAFPEQSSAYASRVPYRETVPGPCDRGAAQPRPDAWSLECGSGLTPIAAGEGCGGTGARSSKSSLDRSSLVVVPVAPDGGRLRPAASGRLDCAGRTRSAEPATSRDVPGRPRCAGTGISRTEVDVDDLFGGPPRERSAPRLSCHRPLSPRRRLDIGSGLRQGRGDLPPGGGNSAVARASCRFPLHVGGANRFRAPSGHAQLRRLRIWHGVCDGPPARAARHPKRPLGTSTCE